MSTFMPVLYSAGKLVHSLLIDALAMPTRPLLLANYFLQFPLLYPLETPTIMLGLLSSLTVGLVTVSLLAIFPPNLFPIPKKVIVLLSLPWLIDAVCQVPGMLTLTSTGLGSTLLQGYSISLTGIITLMIQTPLLYLELYKELLPLSARVFADQNTDRYFFLATAISSYHCISIIEPVFCQFFLKGVAAVCLSFAITPHVWWNFLGQLFNKFVDFFCFIMKHVFSSVFAFVTHVWPFLVDTWWKFINHPYLIIFNRGIAPIWQILSPLLLPVSMATLAYQCGHGREQLAAGNLTHYILLLAIGQGYCTAAAAVSSLVLGIHAIGRLRNRSPQPFSNPWALKFLWVSICILAAPWNICSRILSNRFIFGFIWKLIDFFCNGVWKILTVLCTFAVNFPLLSIPTVLFVNGWIFCIIYTRPSSWLSEMLATPFKVIWELIMPLYYVSDVTFAITLIVIAQIITYMLVQKILQPVYALQQAAIAADIEMPLNVEELDAIAAAMADPRQCGRCAYGPIDHQGCHNLTTHHGERAGRISNACPRCRWFVHSLKDWPRWSVRAISSQIVLRQRVWGEVVVFVRAAAKAMLFPLVCIRLGAVWNLPGALILFLTSSYLVPWCFENANTFFAATHARVSRYQAATEVTCGGEQTGGLRRTGGTASQPIQAKEYIQASDALKNLLAAVPDSIFLKSGDSCSICLDNFGEDGVKTALLPGPQATVALRLLIPAIVALRCGHPLHVTCAEAVVAAGVGANRHVRCPLCREPVSLTGAVSARLFN